MDFFSYAYIFVFFLVGILFVFFALFFSRLLTPSAPSPLKQLPYECGERPIGTSWIQFNIRFYIIALTFIAFDVEIALILPAIVSYSQLVREGLGRFIFLEIFIFIGILIFGLAYLWAKGDLEWIKKLPDKGD